MHPARKKVPTARSVAGRVLLRVERDQAFASASLDTELERALQLNPKDRRLATELVYGVLRTQRYLDQRIERHARRSIDEEVRIHLRVAVYQMAILERIPAFAAVSAAVDLVRDQKGPHAARFANAILRKVAEEISKEGRITLANAVRASVDPHLLRRLEDALGSADQADAMLCSPALPPPLGLRIHQGHGVDDWMQKLALAAPNARFERGKVHSQCICMTGAGRPDALPGFENAWSVQEEGAQVLGIALGAREGERVLDACAGRGNKSLLLAEKVGPNGIVHGADLHPNKLDILLSRARALDLPVEKTFPVDWTQGPGDIPEGYDRVLIDAPCSGIGTSRRRPETLQRDIQQTLRSVQPLQRAILTHAATRCRPGGRIVYAVCSVLREEAEEVVAHVLEQGIGLQPVAFEDNSDIPLLQGKTSLRLLPHEHGTDGYFLASFRRV